MICWGEGEQVTRVSRTTTQTSPTQVKEVHRVIDCCVGLCQAGAHAGAAMACRTSLRGRRILPGTVGIRTAFPGCNKHGYRCTASEIAQQKQVGTCPTGTLSIPSTSDLASVPAKLRLKKDHA
eukprot:g14200.t1